MDYTRFLRLSRKLRKIFFKFWNIYKLKLYHIEFGSGVEIYNKFYFDIHPKSKVKIGQNVRITSGDTFNPLCRNIEGCICAEKENSVIEIGDDCGFSSPCIWAKNKIIIGKRVKIGGDCIIMDSDAHSLDWRIRASKEQTLEGLSLDIVSAKTSPIIIEDDVLIGTRCIILKGVTIGARSVIAAGSVVVKSIPSDCIAGGNPAQIIRKNIGN